MRTAGRENRGVMKPGQDLVVAGYIGQTGTRVIAQEKRRELLTWFRKDYIDTAAERGIVMLDGDLERWKPFGATECESVGEGGVLAALWNLSGAFRTGIECWIRRIPVRQETIELCERYGLNPYRLLAGACLLMPADNGGDLVRSLKNLGIHGAVIGKVTGEMSRILIQGGNIGYLNRPEPDELFKVVSPERAASAVNNINQEVRQRI